MAAAEDTKSSAITNCKTKKLASVYSVPFAGKYIETTVTDNPSAVDAWINETLRSSVSRVFSMDIGVSSALPSLHLCCQNKCLIIRLDKLSFVVPTSLVSFCSDESHYFVGVSIEDKVRRIREEYGYGDLEFRNRIEIADGNNKAKDYWEKLSLQRQISLVTGLMDVFFIKNKRLMQVDSMKEIDSNQAVEEATLNAHVSYLIGAISCDNSIVS